MWSHNLTQDNYGYTIHNHEQTPFFKSRVFCIPAFIHEIRLSFVNETPIRKLRSDFTRFTSSFPCLNVQPRPTAGLWADRCCLRLERWDWPLWLTSCVSDVLSCWRIPTSWLALALSRSNSALRLSLAAIAFTSFLSSSASKIAIAFAIFCLSLMANSGSCFCASFLSDVPVLSFICELS